jgi:hypothetical protein
MAFKHMLIKRPYSSEVFEQIVGQSRFKTCGMKSGDIGFEARFAKP